MGSDTPPLPVLSTVKWLPTPAPRLPIAGDELLQYLHSFCGGRGRGEARGGSQGSASSTLVGLETTGRRAALALAQPQVVGSGGSTVPWMPWSPLTSTCFLLFLNISCQCEVCEKPFSTYESDIFSETVTKCVFCRMSEDLSAEALSAEALSSSSGGEDIRSRECSLGTDD